MGGKRGKKNWSRRQRNLQREANADPENVAKREEERKNKGHGRDAQGGGGQKGNSYVPFVQGNARMEAYYAAQGLHDGRWIDSPPPTDSDSGDGGPPSAPARFVPCATDAEKEAERKAFMDSLRTILSASFRIGRDIGEELRAKLEKELEEHCGKTIEIEVERPDEAHFINPGEETGEGGKTAVAEDGKEGEKDVGKKEAEGEAEAKEGEGDAAKIADGGDTVRVPSTKGTFERRTVHPARPIPFVPHAYQLGVDRRTIRRNPALADFHEWLKVHTAAGFLTRQETVSMIPPVVLNPMPGDRVLDTCAAPGSKTSQMAEALSASAPGEDGEGGGVLDENGEPRGLVVANDADPKRAYMLVAQLRRINVPNIYVCSCDASQFPILDNSKAQRGTDAEGTFDKVLCDVPCSGDGTTRKNPGIWRHWSQIASLALHPLQLSILMRGARLTKIGGYVCYSTCSMNPIENEAVVAEALRRSKGALELVDRREELGPSLKARPGWRKWRVMCEKGKGGMASRKERKNYEKKNNAKMRNRRDEWEEKRKKEAAEKEGGGKEEGEKGAEGAEGKQEATGDAAGAKDKEGNDNAPSAKKDQAGDAAAGVDSDKNGKSEALDSSTNYLPFDQSVFKASKPESWDTAALLERASDAGLESFDTYDDVPEDGNYRKRLRKSCFSPESEEADAMELEKCMRCLPHDMDTGGFFVALFRKVGPMAGLEFGAEGKQGNKGKEGAAVGFLKRKAPEAEQASKEASKDKDGDTKKESKAEGDVAPEAKKSKSEDNPAEDAEAKAETTGAEDSMTEEAMEAAKAAVEEPATETSAAEDMDAEEATKEDDGAGASGTNVEGKDVATTGGDNDDTKAADKSGENDTKPKLKPDKGGGGRGNLPKASREDLFLVPPALLPKIIDFYGFDPLTFPSSQLMTRSATTKLEAKVMYFIGKPVKNQLLDKGVQDRVLTISAGLKAFERNNKDCRVNHRLCQESIQFMAPHMTAAENRLISADPEDFDRCIASGNLRLVTFSDDFAERVRKLEQGSFGVALRGYERNAAAKMYVVMWRCRSDGVNCLVAKIEMDGMRSKLRALGHEAAPKIIVAQTKKEGGGADGSVDEKAGKEDGAADEKMEDATGEGEGGKEN